MFARTVQQVSMVLVLGVSAAGAQLVNGKWQAPAKGSGSAGGAAPRQGVQAQPQPQPATNTTSQANNAVVPIRVIHAVLMSDGSVQADFGAGLEAVQRSCSGDFRYTPLRIIGSLPPVPGVHPAPAPLTESAKALPSAQARAAANQAAKASCHLRDGNGRFFATR